MYIDNISRNFPQDADFDVNSFVGCLHEKGEVSLEEYWKLECSIFEGYNKSKDSAALSRDIVWPLFRIFSYSMLLFGCHLDSKDGFSIKNIDEGQLLMFRERFQLIFEGFFSGKMPDDDMFDLRNPLLKKINIEK